MTGKVRTGLLPFNYMFLNGMTQEIFISAIPVFWERLEIQQE
jgi:hypothetical protein